MHALIYIYVHVHACMCAHAYTHSLLKQDRKVDYSQIHYTVHFSLLTEILISSHYLTYLYCNFRVKHFLAQRAAIKMMSMDIHQMFLQLIRFGEEFEATLTAIFCGSGHEMCGNMLLKGLVIICTRELSTTVRACKSPSGCWTLGTAYSAVLV